MVPDIPSVITVNGVKANVVGVILGLGLGIGVGVSVGFGLGWGMADNGTGCPATYDSNMEWVKHPTPKRALSSLVVGMAENSNMFS
eukprot:g72481.t1